MEESRRLKFVDQDQIIPSPSSSDDDGDSNEDSVEANDLFTYYPDDTQRNKSCRDSVGECVVRVTCTGTVGLVLLLSVLIAAMGLVKVIVAGLFWWRCPTHPDLLTFLLVSGLAPALFYLTCRTRRKRKGAVPKEQRLMGRWELSALGYTFDAERAWQAGLSAVLCVFLLGWLIHGTAQIVVVMQQARREPDDCPTRAVCQPHPHGNAFLLNSSSFAPVSSSPLLSALSLSDLSRRVDDEADKTSSLKAGPSSSTSLSSSSPSSSSPPPSSSSSRKPTDTNARLTVDDGQTRTNRRSILSQQPASKTRRTAASEASGSTVTPSSKTVADLVNEASNKQLHTPQASSASEVTDKTTDGTYSLHVQSSTTSVGTRKRPAPADDAGSDVSVTPSETGPENVGCDSKFLTLCFALVLFDWIYVAALMLNLLIAGTVPCCCFNSFTPQWGTVDAEITVPSV